MNLKLSKKNRIVLVVALVILFITGFHFKKAYATDEDLTYTISVKPLDNQIDKSATYYDLLVKPGDKENLTVIVSNTGKETKEMRVTPTNAITNQNGVVDYSRQSDDYKYDSGLVHPFTSLIGKEQVVEVPAGEQKEVVFELQVPNEPFTGEILGGFLVDVVDKEDKTEDSSQEGVKIVNKFQLVKAVMLRENQDKITPKLVLNDVKPALVSDRTAVTANLQNTEPVLFGGMKVDAKVTEKGKQEVIKEAIKDNLDMAPNSNFDFPIMWGNERLRPGEYTLTLVATSGEETWKFSKDFTITAEESDKINNEAVDLEDEQRPYWLYVVIIALILIILLLVLILLIRNGKKKKEEQRKKKSKSKRNKSKKSSNRKSK